MESLKIQGVAPLRPRKCGEFLIRLGGMTGFPSEILSVCFSGIRVNT